MFDRLKRWLSQGDDLDKATAAREMATRDDEGDARALLRQLTAIDPEDEDVDRDLVLSLVTAVASRCGSEAAVPLMNIVSEVWLWDEEILGEVLGGLAGQAGPARKDWLEALSQLERLRYVAEPLADACAALGDSKWHGELLSKLATSADEDHIASGLCGMALYPEHANENVARANLGGDRYGTGREALRVLIALQVEDRAELLRQALPNLPNPRGLLKPEDEGWAGPVLQEHSAKATDGGLPTAGAEAQLNLLKLGRFDVVGDLCSFLRENTGSDDDREAYVTVYMTQCAVAEALGEAAGQLEPAQRIEVMDLLHAVRKGAHGNPKPVHSAAQHAIEKATGAELYSEYEAWRTEQHST